MSIVFIDLEVTQKQSIAKFGAFVNRDLVFEGDLVGFKKFIKGYEYICGHNSFDHDFKYIDKLIKSAGIRKRIDTLPISALLLAHPNHKLVKDYILVKDELNIPYIDASLSHDLFVEEIQTFKSLDEDLKSIYYNLLGDNESFRHFFKYLGYSNRIRDIESQIRKRFFRQICQSADLKRLIKNNPEELAYCLAIINLNNLISHPPGWLLYKYNNFMTVYEILRGKPCYRCEYCNNNYDIVKFLNNTFGYEGYREFDGHKLQEEAVKSQVQGESVITVFPTAGGKSIAFQVPALILAETVKGLTIVISPLQSLMQDQVQNLRQKHIYNVGTINGSMNNFERSDTIKRVRDGEIHLLYLAPETLRSPSIFRLLSRRNIVRFVIDEAHCFSTWGHEFRVDYLYIAEFIKEIQKESLNNKTIPVSCFTATAKIEVVNDIKEYFKSNLNLDMRVISANTRRENLRFFVHECQDHIQKMNFIRDLLENNPNKPVIIYTSRRKTTEEVAFELNKSGFPANYYHGNVQAELKNQYQIEFSKGTKNIIVATSAFGMGVDKDDVYFVIHYDVSATIEDYIQEAGRAGRDKNIQAECHILYNEEDVNKHFSLLTANKLSKNDVNQVWKTIKRLTKSTNEVSISIKEIAKNSGFDEQINYDVNTKVITSILALEKVNYIKRKQNDVKVYANSIKFKSMIEVRKKIDELKELSDKERDDLAKIMTRLFTDKNTPKNLGAKPISMVDELSNDLSMDRSAAVRYINLLKDKKILDYDNDLVAKIPIGMNLSKSREIISLHINIMKLIISEVDLTDKKRNIKEVYSVVRDSISNVNPREISVSINYLDSCKIIKQTIDSFNTNYRKLKLNIDKDKAIAIIDKLAEVSHFIIDYTYKQFENTKDASTANYSLFEIKTAFLSQNTLFGKELSIEEVEKAILFIIRTGSLVIDGGFLVIYLPMKIEKIERNPQKQYTTEDYNIFMNYYNQKIKKIHILTEFVRELSHEYEKGMTLVDDYFQMPYQDFEKKYITKEFKKYYDKPITKNSYVKLFSNLSDKQLEIIEDKSDKNIVVFAGPGSGKTTLLAHKLAALIQLEDVKPNQLLMLTFSRSATVVFKKKLHDLIGSRSNYVDIKTFHSFCFDVIGEIGSIDVSDTELFKRAVIAIRDKKFDYKIVDKTTLVIDEAQDMSQQEYELIQSLVEYNEKLRLIAVGDDDQNIFEFRGSDSKFLSILAQDSNVYELLTNFRSRRNLVEFTQDFSYCIKDRLKKHRCVSNIDADGNIRLYKYNSDSFYEPLINQIKLLVEDKNSSKHSIAVLTVTNEEAEIIYGLLAGIGVESQLVQSNNNFRLYDLEETIEFIKYFDTDLVEIPNEVWKSNVSSFKNEFAENPLLPLILNMLNDFDSLYPKKKYFSDLSEFIKESRMVDLYRNHNNIVTISTIHKSKGKEFDTVFVLQKDKEYTQADYKAIYVGLTRAKSNLIIHTNSDVYDGMYEINEIEEIYEEPKELLFQMEYRDVNLGSSKYCQKCLENVFTGTNLEITDKGLTYQNKPALYFSAKMHEYIENKKSHGYNPIDAKVVFKVRWYNSDENKYFWIVLPLLRFEKSNQVSDLKPNVEG